MKLEKLAQGRACYLRLPGVCNGVRETTVLCHIRRGNTGGTGIKPPPVCAVPMCHACHDEFDGRTDNGYTRQQLDAECLRALVQWLDYLWRAEYIVSP